MKLAFPVVGTAFAALLIAPSALPAAQLSASHGLALTRLAPTQAVDLNVHLPLRNAAQLEQLVELQGNPHSPLFHHFLSVSQFRASFGPSPLAFARATGSLRSRGFVVVAQSSQGLRVRAAAANVERAFGTRLNLVRDTRGTPRIAAATPAVLPADLAGIGATITGIDGRPQLHVDSTQVPMNRRSAFGGYYFTDLKQAYTYPSYQTLNGKGATIGILMESDVLDSDTIKQFNHEHFSRITGAAVPTVLRRPVAGGNGVSGPGFAEASIDVQTPLGSAPGASEILYDTPDLSDASIMAGYTQIDEDNLVDVVSSSFGECELFYTRAYNSGTDYTGILKAEHELFLQGNSQGITFLASSGDSAGLGCTNPAYLTGQPGAKFIAGVETPAADPNVTAVGGTNLQTTAPPSPQPSVPVLTSKYVSENEYGNAEIPYDPYGVGDNASGGYWGSGGGVSTLYAKPSYQKLIDTGASRRAVPDVSMQMGGCPGGISITPCNPGVSFSIYYLGGTQYGFIGTSLSSPEFAGLLALKIQESKGRLGNVNGLIYALAARNAAAKPFQYFHQGIPGYNGVISTPAGRAGYNTIVGVGTPNARAFLGVPTFPLAGDPQTPSNP